MEQTADSPEAAPAAQARADFRDSRYFAYLRAKEQTDRDFITRLHGEVEGGLDTGDGFDGGVRGGGFETYVPSGEFRRLQPPVYRAGGGWESVEIEDGVELLFPESSESPSASGPGAYLQRRCQRLSSWSH
jgi:hypothetical protein